jgi:predicted nuclease of predicted toxin-antitoxin system
MQFKVDENLHVEIAESLRVEGHDAMTVADQGLVGKEDEIVAEICRDDNRALVTIDLDFANEIKFPPQDYRGFIVLRMSKQSRPRALKAIGQVLSLLKTRSPDRSLWIVEETRIRIRTPTCCRRPEYAVNR